jgi:hypothetical protein
LKSILGESALVTGYRRFRKRRTETTDCVMDPQLGIAILVAFAFTGLMGWLGNRA